MRGVVLSALYHTPEQYLARLPNSANSQLVIRLQFGKPLQVVVRSLVRARASVDEGTEDDNGASVDVTGEPCFSGLWDLSDEEAEEEEVEERGIYPVRLRRSKTRNPPCVTDIRGVEKEGSQYLNPIPTTFGFHVL